MVLTRWSVLVVGLAGVAAGIGARAPLSSWGARRAEVDRSYPGDELVPEPAGTTTYAVSIDAPAQQVWSWLVQIGQDRGGMYSYELLENLLGLNIHNAEEIRGEWQQLTVGDQVRVVPAGRLGMPDGYAFRVALVDPPCSLVLRQRPPEHPWDATWAFHVVDEPDGGCRLLSRSRSAHQPGLAGLAARGAEQLMRPVILLMTRRMLLGIKERAERTGSATASRGT